VGPTVTLGLWEHWFGASGCGIGVALASPWQWLSSSGYYWSILQFSSCKPDPGSLTLHLFVNLMLSILKFLACCFNLGCL